MDIAIARQIIAAVDACDNPARLCENYSGRGMFGTKTTAVEVDDLAAWMTAVSYAIIDSDDPHAIAGAMAKIRHDDLGRGLIFY